MITNIRIENFRSIEKMNLNIENNIICFLGKNGSGKSTIFKAIHFFFNNLNKKYSDNIVIDRINPYIQKCVISITFNIHLLNIKAQYNKKLESDFRRITKHLNFSSSNKAEFELTMTQYRDGTIFWNIDDIEIRNTIKNVFPLYYIDTRYLDLFSWDKLWEIINDLSISVPQIEEEKYIEILDSAFEEIYGKKYSDSKEILTSLFTENSISLDKYHFESRLASAFSMRFGGNHFLINDRKLDFYSDGTNSFNYILLLISLIPKISITSCKFPIIIVDEPEIGLHNTYINEYVSCICENIKQNALLLMSTHSPKIISELANNTEKYSLYKVDSYRLYTLIKKMNLSWLKNKSIVTIKETECYFSDYLLYLEGETELQIFKNKYILSLYPKLSKVHFYSFDSNDSRLRNAHSNTLNLGINYKILVDIDKILKYDNKNNKFKLGNDILLNPIQYNIKNNLDLFNYNKFPDNLNIKGIRELIEILLKETYTQVPNNHYFANRNYDRLIENVIKYCKYYNIIVNKTTIEGELITVENIDKFLSYIETLQIPNNDKLQHEKIKLITDKKEQTVKVICECNGRTELQNTGETKYKSILGKKTDGWVTKWIEYYFENYIEPIAEYNKKLIQFKKDFPSLNNTLQIVIDMI